jgi:hypothetical protein
MVAKHHDIYLFEVPQWGYQAEETDVIEISPRGNRIVVLANVQLGGVLVLDTAQYDVAYRIEELEHGRSSVGAGFSADGETLFAAVQTGVTTGHRMSVAAVDGESGDLRAYRDSLEIFTLGGGTLHVDPRGGYVYIVGQRDRRPALVVLDAATLETVAQIDLPHQTCLPDDLPRFMVDLVLDQGEDRLYAVWMTHWWQFGTPGNSCIEWFDLPSEG